MATLHPDVEGELATRFSGQDLVDAKLLLETTLVVGVGDRASSGGARIHIAALKVAGGSLEQLKVAMKVATEDWRDLLMSAGLGHADWRHVLATGGFRVPR